MAKQEIKAGLKFTEPKKAGVFTITKITKKYVFFNSEKYPTGWHVGKDKFERKFSKFGAKIIYP